MEEIEKRRKEIREKIKEKSKVNVEVFGILLVIVIFGFLLFSNLPKEEVEQGNEGVDQSAKIKIEINNTESHSEIASQKENVKEALKPPIPEEFNESMYKKVSIFDDDQSAIWSNLDPMAVYLYDDFNDKVSGESSLKIVQKDKRAYWPLVEYTFTSTQDWSNAKFISFWFKGNKTGLVFDVYIYFNNWKNYVVLRFKDIYDGWQRFVFSTEKNIIKNGEIDWNNVWKIRIANNNRNYKGTFYFDDFSIWVNKSEEEGVEKEAEEKVYTLGDTIVKGDLAVTLNRFYDRYEVKYFSGKTVYQEYYSGVEITIKNIGSREIYPKFTPYKPVLIDDLGNTYTYQNVRVRKPYGLWVEHEDQLKLDVIYPNATRRGIIFFKPEASIKAKNMTLVLYINNKRFEFRFKRW